MRRHICTALRVKNIKSTDLGNAHSDPYVRMSILEDTYDTTQQSTTKNSKTTGENKEAVFSPLAPFTFHITTDKDGKTSGVLLLEVFDHDVASKDDIIGSCKIQLTKSHGNKTEWIPLVPAGSGSIEVQWGEVCDVERVDITILGCKELASEDLMGQSDPFVRVTYNNKTCQTKHFENKSTCVFNETFSFLKSRDAKAQIKFNVLDKDDGSRDDEIGAALYPLEDHITQVKESWIPLGDVKRGYVGFTMKVVAPAPAVEVMKPTPPPSQQDAAKKEENNNTLPVATITVLGCRSQPSSQHSDVPYKYRIVNNKTSSYTDLIVNVPSDVRNEKDIIIEVYQLGDQAKRLGAVTVDYEKVKNVSEVWIPVVPIEDPKGTPGDTSIRPLLECGVKIQQPSQQQQRSVEEKAPAPVVVPSPPEEDKALPPPPPSPPQPVSKPVAPPPEQRSTRRPSVSTRKNVELTLHGVQNMVCLKPLFVRAVVGSTTHIVPCRDASKPAGADHTPTIVTFLNVVSGSTMFIELMDSDTGTGTILGRVVITSISESSPQLTWHPLGAPAVTGALGIEVHEHDVTPAAPLPPPPQHVVDKDRPSTSSGEPKPQTAATTTSSQYLPLIPCPPKPRDVSTAVSGQRPRNPNNNNPSSPQSASSSQRLESSSILARHSEVRRQRQIVECEVAQIQNAVARIERAERKIVRVAEELRRKADALLEAHNRQETAAAWKQRFREWQIQEKTQQHQVVTKQRSEDQRTLMMAKQRHTLLKRKGAVEVRKEREILECKVNIQKEQERIRNVALHETVASVQERINQKIEADRERRQRAVLEDTEKKFFIEERTRSVMERRKVVVEEAKTAIQRRLEEAKERQENEQRHLENVLATIQRDIQSRSQSLNNSRCSSIRQSVSATPVTAVSPPRHAEGT